MREVEVGIAVDQVGNSRVTYRLGVFAQGAEMPAAEGHFIHVYFGRADRRPIPLPPGWRAALEGLL